MCLIAYRKHASVVDNWHNFMCTLHKIRPYKTSQSDPAGRRLTCTNANHNITVLFSPPADKIP